MKCIFQFENRKKARKRDRVAWKVSFPWDMTNGFMCASLCRVCIDFVPIFFAFFLALPLLFFFFYCQMQRNFQQVTHVERSLLLTASNAIFFSSSVCCFLFSQIEIICICLYSNRRIASLVFESSVFLPVFRQLSTRLECRSFSIARRIFFQLHAFFVAWPLTSKSKWK